MDLKIFQKVTHLSSQNRKYPSIQVLNLKSQLACPYFGHVRTQRPRAPFPGAAGLRCARLALSDESSNPRPGPAVRGAAPGP